MLNQVLSKVFGTKHDRDVKRMQPMVDAINELEPQMEALSDDELRAKTDEFRSQLADGASLDDLLVPRLRGGARSGPAHRRPAPLRRAADRRHRPARGQDRRDEDR